MGSRFSDRTFNNLQAEALQDLTSRLNQLPENQQVDASEGSLLYMSLARQSVRLAEAYEDLEAVNDNILVDRQDFDFLISSGAECGIRINEGKPAFVLADINCQCTIGAEFSAIDSDYNYRAIKLEEIINNADGTTTYRYRMIADEQGVDPGNYRGEIEPEDYLEGFETGRVIDTYSAGTEMEEENAYRERRMNSYASRECAGNREYYLNKLGALPEVGGVKIERRQYNQNTIPCYIQSSTYGVPTAAQLASIQEAADPVGFEGEGMGICPLGHVIDLHAVEGVTIDVTASFVFDDGYTFAMLKTAMDTAITEYITELAQTWQDSNSIVVRRAVIESKLLEITGVLDIDDVLLNNIDGNITTTTYQIPIYGDITEAVS